MPFFALGRVGLDQAAILLRLLQFLNGSNILTPQFLIKFMHPLDELR